MQIMIKTCIKFMYIIIKYKVISILIYKIK